MLMNQLEKILFWNKKYNLIFLLCHFFIIFLPLCYLLGTILWLQSFMLTIIFMGIFFFLFSKSFHCSFDGQEIQGYDSWHLKPLKDQYLQDVQIKIISHHLPFFITYEMLGKKKVLLSSNFLKKNSDIEQWFIFLSSCFDTGVVQKSTKWSYVFFLILSPFFWIEKFSRGTHFKFLQRVSHSLYSFLFFILTLPYLPFLRNHFYKIDQKGCHSFKTPKRYLEGLWKMQYICNLQPWNQKLYFSPLFPINVLTHFRFYPSIHPSIEGRIRSTGETFPI